MSLKETTMKRKLASIQKIESLTPIEGADKIEQATVMGWSIVVKKGEFQVGSPCCFFEIDSILPQHAPWSQFLACKGYRIKSVKLRGVLSQGLALPVSIIPEGTRINLREPLMNLGEDVTEILGVAKYEVPETDSPDIAGPFIPGVPKTDEIRIQSSLGMLTALRGQPYYITEKADGTSCTVGKIDGKIYVCSRNNEVTDGANVYWAAVRKYELNQKIRDGVALQFEVVGPGIQKNRLGLSEVEIRVFDIFNRMTGQYLPWDVVKERCSKERADLPTVKLIERGESFNYCLDDLLEMAKGKYAGTNNNREGIVVRPLKYQRFLTGERLSFKCLNNEFLLKNEE
jgi:RNA ligase (TIGR02306 family)